MFRATCDCGKFNVSRSHLVTSWIGRLCKKCKSHIKVYSDNMLVYDYNNPSERARARVQGYTRLTKCGKILPKLIQLPPPPPPSPIIHDVFMGYSSEIPDIEPKYMINPYYKDEITMFNEIEFPFDYDLNNF